MSRRRFKLEVRETDDGKYAVRLDACGVVAVGSYDSLKAALRAVSKSSWILDENESEIVVDEVPR